MPTLTIHNWREELARRTNITRVAEDHLLLDDRLENDTGRPMPYPENEYEIDANKVKDFCTELIEALKAEAIKQIEKEKAKNDHDPDIEFAKALPFGKSVFDSYDQGMTRAQNIINNL